MDILRLTEQEITKAKLTWIFHLQRSGLGRRGKQWFLIFSSSQDSMVSELFSDRVKQLATVGEDEIAADRIMEDFQDQQDQVTMHRWEELNQDFLRSPQCYPSQLSGAIDRITKQIEQIYEEQNQHVIPVFPFWFPFSHGKQLFFSLSVLILIFFLAFSLFFVSIV